MFGGLFLLCVGMVSMRWSSWGMDARKFPVFIVGLTMVIIGVVAVVTSAPL